MALSKTARASMLAGEGHTKRTPVAWVFQHRIGKIQRQPWRIFYHEDELGEWLAGGEGQSNQYYVIDWRGRR